jgi:hypothetical protein
VSVQFLTNELAKWDEVAGGALVVTVFQDERPLRGAAGLADWRLCGRLSRLVKHERIRGERGETLMMPPGRRLRFDRLILFGLGPSKGFGEELYREHVRWIRHVLHRAGIKDYAVQPPGRATGLIAARRALEVWMEEGAQSDITEGEVAIIDTAAGQKEMSDILHLWARS